MVKNKDKTKSDYIKIKNDMTLRQGQILNLDSKTDLLKNLDTVEASGKMSAEMASDIRERLNKIPDFVRFEISYFEEK